jgi:hypothetical protein
MSFKALFLAHVRHRRILEDSWSCQSQIRRRKKNLLWLPKWTVALRAATPQIVLLQATTSRTITLWVAVPHLPLLQCRVHHRFNVASAITTMLQPGAPWVVASPPQWCVYCIVNFRVAGHHNQCRSRHLSDFCLTSVRPPTFYFYFLKLF